MRMENVNVAPHQFEDSVAELIFGVGYFDARNLSGIEQALGMRSDVCLENEVPRRELTPVAIWGDGVVADPLRAPERPDQT